MAPRCVVVGSKVRLHAHPADLLVQAVNRPPVKMTIAKEGKEPVGAGGIFVVFGLGVGGSEGVVRCADGDGVELALSELAELVVGP